MPKFKGKILAVLMVGVFVSIACAGVQPVKQYELGKVAAETILYDARVLQNKGVLTAQQFDQVRKVYDQLKAAQDVAIDSRKALIAYNTDTNQERATKAMNNVLNLSMQLIGLAQSMGIKVQ